MLLKMKTVWVIILATAVLLLSACSPSTRLVQTTVTNTAIPSQQNLKTTMGDFIIVSVHLVDEVHESKAPDGNKFLLIGLVHPDLQKPVPGEFSLESFQTMILDSNNEIYILGNDGSQTFYSHMGGWIEDDFVIGFTVPLVETYTLYWTNNSPIPLKVEE